MSVKINTIIVNWNTREYLRKCLDSVDKFFPSYLNHTIVIDNNSSDGSAEMVEYSYPLIELHKNSENIGFARACNQGMSKGTAEFILLLNSDCEVTDKNLLIETIRLFETDESIGLIGPLILYPNGHLQSAGQDFISLAKLIKYQLLFSSSPLFSRKIKTKENKQPFEADYVSGSCLFIRRDIFRTVGMFNESFVMYAEDMDLCYRAKQAGYKVLVIPNVSIIHYKSKSTNNNLVKSISLSVRNNCIFIKKRSGLFAAFLALLIYTIGTALRIPVAFFRHSTSAKDWFLLFVLLPFLWNDIIRFKE